MNKKVVSTNDDPLRIERALKQELKVCTRVSACTSLACSWKLLKIIRHTSFAQLHPQAHSPQHRKSRFAAVKKIPKVQGVATQLGDTRNYDMIPTPQRAPKS